MFKPLYKTQNAYRGMIHRCYIDTNPNFHNYGGRGIRVCKEWLDSFQAFLDHVGLPPGPEYSIERINVNGHYEPNNVHWATPEVQASNKRNSIRWDEIVDAICEDTNNAVPQESTLTRLIREISNPEIS